MRMRSHSSNATSLFYCTESDTFNLSLASLLKFSILGKFTIFGVHFESIKISSFKNNFSAFHLFSNIIFNHYHLCVNVSKSDYLSFIAFKFL